MAACLVVMCGRLEAGTCVKAEGDALPAFLFRNDESAQHDAALAFDAVPEAERARLKQVAEAMADAGCNTDSAGLVSAIGVFAYLDGTAIEIDSLVLDQLAKSRKELNEVVTAFGSAAIRKGEPVVVRLIPVRIGGIRRPRIVAVLRPNKKPEYTVCSDPGCKPAPAPAKKR